MSLLWVVLLTLLACRSKAVDEHNTEKDEQRAACSLEFCGPNLRPIPMVQREKRNAPEKDGTTRRRDERIYEERFPHGREMIKTNFKCEDKPYIPGFYADMEADCKIFHLCRKTVVEHYMCPGHTSFNQETLVCAHEEKVHCHRTPEYYVMNADLHAGHPIIPGTKEFAFNKESDKWLYDIIQEHNVTDEDAVERNLIRMLILMKFIDVSDLLSDVLEEEEFLSNRTKKSMESFSATQLKEMLDHILHEVFPILPIVLRIDPLLNMEEQNTTEGAEGARSLDSTESPGAAELRQLVQINLLNFEFSRFPIRAAWRILEVLFRAVAQSIGKLTTASRMDIVSNHINYLNNRYLYPRP